ncbi:MAG: hypothetical protein AAB417_02380 [Patescibacteria group bacterium]
MKIILGGTVMALLAVGLGRRIKQAAKDLEVLADQEYKEREERLGRTKPPQH